MIKASELDLRLEQHRQEILAHFNSALIQLVTKFNSNRNFLRLWEKLDDATFENSTPFAVNSDFKISLLDIINLPGYEKLRELCAERNFRLKIELKNDPVISEAIIWPTLMITITKVQPSAHPE